MGMDALLEKVVKTITPTAREEQEMRTVVGEVQEAVRTSIGKLSSTLAGSFTRGTWMTDKKEFDIFIMFPEHTKRETLEKKGLALGKKIVSVLGGSSRVAYAEHPYTRARYRGFAIDIVPCYKVADASRIQSAVDRTPFHNTYLARNFAPELAAEVRLLKKFLKANGLYGSDTRVQGFSGYLCELLMLRYKSFAALARAAANWEPGMVIDLKGRRTAPPSFGQPLQVIDPVDQNRNVAAVITPLNFVRFVGLCSAFVRRPSERFFFRKKAGTTIEQMKKMMNARGTLFLGILFRKPDVIDDVLYPQMRRTGNRLSSLMKDYEFTVLGQEEFSDQKMCILFFEMEVWSLPQVRKLIGPRIQVTTHAKEFLHKYRKARFWVSGDCWVAEVKRRFPLAEDLLKKTLSQRPGRLREAGIAGHVAHSLSRGFRILKGGELLRRPAARELLRDYMERTIEQS